MAFRISLKKVYKYFLIKDTLLQKYAVLYYSECIMEDFVVLSTLPNILKAICLINWKIGCFAVDRKPSTSKSFETYYLVHKNAH